MRSLFKNNILKHNILKNNILILSYLILTLLSLTLAPFKAFAWDYMDINNYYCQPYLGIDAQWRYTQPVNGFGSNLFKRHYLQGNLYFGLKLCDYLGVELGYEMTPTRTKTSTLNGGELSLGVPVTDPPEVHLSKSRIKGWHVGLMGFYPVCNFLGNSLFRNPVELLAYVGTIRSHCYYQDVQVLEGSGPVNINNFTRTFDQTRSLLRLGLGAQYTYCTSGVRFMIGYESTKQFNNVSSQEFALSSPKRLKLKDSWFISLGMFVTIP